MHHEPRPERRSSIEDDADDPEDQPDGHEHAGDLVPQPALEARFHLEPLQNAGQVQGPHIGTPLEVGDAESVRVVSFELGQ